ncbi:zinc finger protein 106 [Lampris incognitus]|uniref:zinc finger protein 106 n=1 Tax=Lampris incognitus TaxID=2546036 RepID=UPI0024B599AF|nr:zinc finger protein 106 [Lampris incognitus]
MGRERKCILCEMICNSKQEMDEHMRSMLHHRELENLKGRDCGHECKVCQVIVLSLTDYASHISSTLHKENVEATERRNAGNDQDEDYFDRALVDLIEKRKELIRKEEEAAATKRAKEEAERLKQQEFQRRLKEAKERFQQDCAWRQRGVRGPNRQGAWTGSQLFGSRGAGGAASDSRPWQHRKQGKSATWHAQQPPNFRNYGSGEWAGGSFQNQEGWGNKQWDQGAFPGSQRGRLPWLSNGGSAHGVYGRNNISQYQQKSGPSSLFGSVSSYPPPPSFFACAIHNQGSGQGGRLDGHQNGVGQNTECDRNSGPSTKTFGSNPKLDKACRWSPYPPAKLFDSVPQKESHSSPLEKRPKVPTPQEHEKASDTSAINRQLQHKQKVRPLNCDEERGDGKNKKSRYRRQQDSSNSRSSSAQGDAFAASSPGPSKQMAEKPVELRNQKDSLMSGVKTPLCKASSQEHKQSKSTTKQSGISSKISPIGPLQSRQEQQLSEMLKKAKETMLEKRVSADISSDNRMALHIAEEQQKECLETGVGANKENNCRQEETKVFLPDSIKPFSSGEDRMRPVLPSADSSQSLQSVQVSTSTAESSGPMTSGGEDGNDGSKREKEGSGSLATEAMETGQGSESDVSGSSEMHTASGSTASSFSKLGLPPVLERDLTKHMSSKSKMGSREPNLNIARRVRNLSESRRGEAEKESGLKPTVRQLISCSGSRRSVNWEQVYQEVRKKQEQGKGMPRFGIEMVSCDQEEQSQEEDGIHLLEGFQWESLTDNPTPMTPRKRCLSESSVAPDRSASSNSLFVCQTSKQTPHSVEFGRPGAHSSSGQQQGSLKADSQRQTEGTPRGSVKDLQRSDSVLGDSSSGTELCDAQGTGKKRRAGGDIPSPEPASLERKSKRRKIKSKREKLQVDQLLTVSLREEELSRTLQTVDSSLIRARAALESAYLEVQRLLVVKQQMTTEMSALRNKRIELLKGMQDGFEGAAQLNVKEEKMDCVAPEPCQASTLSVVSDTALSSMDCANQLDKSTSPRSATLPFTPVVVKQEPLSPVSVTAEPEPEPEPEDNLAPCAHSTTPELPRPPSTASYADTPENCLSSLQRRCELYQADRESIQDGFREPAGSRESLSALGLMMERAVKAKRDSITPSSSDLKPNPSALSPASRRSSEAGSLAEQTASQSCELSSAPRVLTAPPSPPELRNGRRVRRLKKRRTLKKTQGAEPAESSDTELEMEEVVRPRRIRTRRRPSGGSHVSTSTPPAAMEGEEEEQGVNEDKSRGLGVEEPHCLLSLAARPKEDDFDSLLEMVELPQVAPIETVNVDSWQPEDKMEVSAAYQQPQTYSQTPASGPVPDSSRAEPQKLACNEVTSTSDMDVSHAVKPHENDAQMPLALAKMSKPSSDASSDPGEDNMPTEGPFEGHHEAVNAMQIDNGLLYTCSGDRTVRAFNLVSHKCVAVFEGHSSKVNCLVVSAMPGLQHRLYSGSSDQTIRCYSLKTGEFEQQFCLPDRVLCLHSRWRILYAGLANGTVVTFNLKTNKQLDVFECHGPRAVSCLASAQAGARKILLVGSFDSTISVRDAKNGLLLRTLKGHTKTVLCMKVVNDLVFSGSSDQFIHTHNIYTGELVRIYKGHSHAVTVVAVMGKVMITACLDKLVRVYELQSHEKLQVYGGHKDMLMCMAVHKSMIYTGCYDGSVQAVKLNLMQNYRCWWHGCSLNFGLMEHLQHHLLNDHTNPNLQTLKCRWKNCDEFFSSRNCSKQGVPTHMQKHAEEEAATSDL